MVAYSLVFSARSRRDLIAVQLWLGQPGSGLKARLKIARISRALTELQFSPHRWPVGDHPGLHQRVIEAHVILYRIEPSVMEVRIIRVFGPYQDRATS